MIATATRRHRRLGSCSLRASVSTAGSSSSASGARPAPCTSSTAVLIDQMVGRFLHVTFGVRPRSSSGPECLPQSELGDGHPSVGSDGGRSPRLDTADIYRVGAGRSANDDHGRHRDYHSHRRCQAGPPTVVLDGFDARRGPASSRIRGGSGLGVDGHANGGGLRWAAVFRPSATRCHA
jgi:hypothetical protein